MFSIVIAWGPQPAEIVVAYDNVGFSEPGNHGQAYGDKSETH